MIQEALTGGIAKVQAMPDVLPATGGIASAGAYGSSAPSGAYYGSNAGQQTYASINPAQQLTYSGSGSYGAQSDGSFGATSKQHPSSASNPYNQRTQTLSCILLMGHITTLMDMVA